MFSSDIKERSYLVIKVILVMKSKSAELAKEVKRAMVSHMGMFIFWISSNLGEHP